MLVRKYSKKQKINIHGLRQVQIYSTEYKTQNKNFIIQKGTKSRKEGLCNLCILTD